MIVIWQQRSVHLTQECSKPVPMVNHFEVQKSKRERDRRIIFSQRLINATDKTGFFTRSLTEICDVAKKTWLTFESAYHFSRFLDDFFFQNDDLGYHIFKSSRKCNFVLASAKIFLKKHGTSELCNTTLYWKLHC